MNNQITIFNNPQFGEVRTIIIGGKPYFVGKDVAKSLGYVNARDAMVKHVDEEDKGVANCDTLGGVQQMVVINESGVYSLIFGSKLPNAKQFKHWVTSEVLPTIRKTGGYITTNADMTDAEILAKAVLVAQTTIDKRNERIKQLEAENGEQKVLIAQMQKGNDYLNTILQSTGTVTTTQIAQDYGFSAMAFNKKLNDMRIQHKVNGQWILYSGHQAKGYVHSKTITFYRSDGRPDTKMCTNWTQRGRLFLYDALKEVGILPMIERNNNN